MKSRSLDSINVNIDENKLFTLKNELKKIIKITTNESEDHENAGDNSILSKKE